MESRSCEFKMHCGGMGYIQVHVIDPNFYCCLECAAGEESITVEEVLNHLERGHRGIRTAESRPTRDDDDDDDQDDDYI